MGLLIHLLVCHRETFLQVPHSLCLLPFPSGQVSFGHIPYPVASRKPELSLSPQKASLPTAANMGRSSREKSPMLLNVPRVEIGAKPVGAEGSQQRHGDSETVYV